MGSLTLALLTGDVSAVKYRPPTGATPWYKTASVGKIADPDYPINYPVANFGVDKDIKVSTQNMGEAEKSVGTKMRASFKKPKGHPVDYKVPDFGVDNDIRLSMGNLK